MAPLLEAHRDGRLAGKDAASFARHFAVCNECRAHARELDEMRDLLRAPATPPLSPFEHQRRRLALLRAAAAPENARAAGTSRVPVRAAAAALAIAACAAIGLFARGSSKPGDVPLAGRLPEAVFRMPDRTATTIEGSAGARFDRSATDGIERVALGEGTIDLEVKKLAPGERFIVVTSDAEVEVRGTIFQVAAVDGRIARVAVSEGKVEVRYRRAVSLVPAGGEWRPPAAEIAAQPAGPSDPGAIAPIAPVASARQKPIAVAAPPASAPKGNTASKDFADAMGLLERGDYAAAAERLDAFGSANPGDARAADAAFLAIVSLQRAGRRAEAAAAARRYLARFPRGDRRAEAQAVANAAP